MNPKVEEYLLANPKWKELIERLRIILLDVGLTEELKWGVPCYTSQGSNIALIGTFKDNCTLSFVKGVLLKDSSKILLKPGENSQSVRIIRLEVLSEVDKLELKIREYLTEAIQLEKEGVKVDFKDNNELELVEELQQRLNEFPELKSAFLKLTPGRRRAYNMFFSAAKHSKTRMDRIEKYTQRILNGKGMNDCVCGHSKRMPSCDGSHKLFQ